MICFVIYGVNMICFVIYGVNMYVSKHKFNSFEKNVWYSNDLGWFFVEIFHDLAWFFFYPDPFHWSGSGWPKWNGSKRIDIFAVAHQTSLHASLAGSPTLKWLMCNLPRLSNHRPETLRLTNHTWWSKYQFKPLDGTIKISHIAFMMVKNLYLPISNEFLIVYITSSIFLRIIFLVNSSWRK